jgi:ATP-dependent Lhr-like helicase
MGAGGEREVFAQLARPIRRLVEEKGFMGATEPQVRAIPPILAGKNVLLVAPTGTGKTEAAFLPILHHLVTGERGGGVKVLYITPLRALNRDLLERLQFWCMRLDLRLAVRHGDTETRERGRQALIPPDILITTPETLQAILPGRVMRRHLAQVRWVVVDEVHELAESKRGSQLALALERLRHIAGHDFQVVGLSATIGDPQRVARFLVGVGRDFEVVQVPVAKGMAIDTLYPEPGGEDLELASRLYTYPEVAARLRVIRQLVEASRSALIFTNTRTEAEVLGSRFRVWDLNLPVAVHHGSLAKPTRLAAERDLKEGRLWGVVCTSSLELGIDIGLLELVIQYNSPRQVTRLIQRVGRAGHQIGRVSKGVVITQDADDALEAMVIARRALREELEEPRIPDRPYDVLAHQLAGLLLHKARWYVDEALELVRRAYPFRHLRREELIEVLRYLHSRQPRVVWFDEEREVFTRPLGLQALYHYYFENLSMIPDERQYLVVTEEGEPVGVLDEAFVAEHGELGVKFVVGGRVWSIQQIYRDRIYVKPEEDPRGAIPSWVGEEIPVPFEVAQEVGAIRREAAEALAAGRALKEVAEALAARYPVKAQVVEQALREVEEQIALGLPVPSDRLITVEGWGEYVVVQACLGHLINRALARLLGRLASERLGTGVGVHQDPYRVILHTGELPAWEVRDMLLSLVKLDLQAAVVDSLTRTGLFKRRFLHVAKKFGAIAKDADLSLATLSELVESFQGTPVYEEAVKVSLAVDVDVAGLQRVLEMVDRGDIRVEVVVGEELSPIARVGIEEMARKADILPPDRLRKVILKSGRARLLSEARTLVCTGCWDYVESVRVADLEQGFSCPLCGSDQYSLTSQGEEAVWALAERVHRGGEPPKRFRRLYRELLAAQALLKHYGFPAAVALAGRGLRLSEVREVLKREPRFSDRLVELVMEAEKRALRRRFPPGVGWPRRG